MEKAQNFNNVLKETDIRIISDSVVIASPTEYKEGLAVVVKIMHSLELALYDCEPDPVLLRGAVSMGDFYMDDVMMVGQGLVDAYLAQEKYSVYTRIILSQEVLDNDIYSIEEGVKLDEDDDGYSYVHSLRSYLWDDTGEHSGDEGWEKISESKTAIYFGCKRYHKLKDFSKTILGAYNNRSLRVKYLWLDEHILIVPAIGIRKALIGWIIKLHFKIMINIRKGLILRGKSFKISHLAKTQSPW